MYAAYEFIKFMTSHDANLAVAAGNTGYLPIRQSVAEDPAYEALCGRRPRYMRAGVEQSDRYFYEPVFTNATTTSSAVNSAVKTMMQEVADNGMEPELALANLKQTVGTNWKRTWAGRRRSIRLRPAAAPCPGPGAQKGNLT